MPPSVHPEPRSHPSSADRLRTAASLGARSLSGAAAARVGGFLERQVAADGGGRNRGGASDLYYSFFALAGLEALGQARPSPQTVAYLDSFGDGAGLELVDLCCLVRSLARVPERREAALAAAAHLDRFLAEAGGYRAALAIERGTVSASFAVRLAREELALPDAGDEHALSWMAAARARDGSWADVVGLDSGTTTVTAAVALMGAADVSTGAWLSARHATGGGFRAGTNAPAPDLLSTAAALVALDALGVPLGRFAEPSVGFVCSLWSDDGGFRGWAGDTASDAEFTYYALVTLGAPAGEAS